MRVKKSPFHFQRQEGGKGERATDSTEAIRATGVQANIHKLFLCWILRASEGRIARRTHPSRVCAVEPQISSFDRLLRQPTSNQRSSIKFVSFPPISKSHPCMRGRATIFGKLFPAQTRGKQPGVVLFHALLLAAMASYHVLIFLFFNFFVPFPSFLSAPRTIWLFPYFCSFHPYLEPQTKQNNIMIIKKGRTVWWRSMLGPLTGNSGTREINSESQKKKILWPHNGNSYHCTVSRLSTASYV